MKLNTGAFCFAMLALRPAVAESRRLGGKRVKNGRHDYFEVLEPEELDAFALTFDEKESTEFWVRHLQASSSLAVLPTPPPTTIAQPAPPSAAPVLQGQPAPSAAPAVQGQTPSAAPAVQAQPQPTAPPTIMAQPQPRTPAPTVVPIPPPTPPPTTPSPQPQPTPPPTVALPQPPPTPPPTVALPPPPPTPPPTAAVPQPQPTSPPTAAVPQPQPTAPPTMAQPQPTLLPTTIAVNNRCANVNCTNPIEGCDPLDGQCKPIDAAVPCIAIVDESSQPDNYISGLWDTFRAQYPDRPFCLLRPLSGSVSDRLYLPPSFINDPRTTYANVSRDGLGDQSVIPGISDWFNICGLGIYQGSDIQYIGEFLDTSGSMRLSTVAASNDLFLANVRGANLQIREVFNGFEDWITPFLTTLVPSSGRRTALRRTLLKHS